MSEWVRLDTERFDRPKPQKIRGVNVTVRVSPYDIPDAVRGYYDEGLRRFVIEFRYMNDEPIKKQHKENIALRIGRYSNRLYGIEVDMAAITATAISSNLVPKKVINAIGSLSNSENYEIARDAIEQNQDEIFANLIAA